MTEFRTASDIIAHVKHMLPRWRDDFPSEDSSTEISRKNLLILIVEIERLRAEQTAKAKEE